MKKARLFSAATKAGAKPMKLIAERGQSFASNLGHAFAIGIGNHVEWRSMPPRPTRAMMPNSAQQTEIELMTAVC